MNNFETNLIGARIKYLRETVKVSTHDTAEKLSIGKVFYEDMEKGMKTPDLSLIVRLANMYNISTDFILGRTYETPRIQEIMNHLLLTQREIDVIKPNLLLTQHGLSEARKTLLVEAEKYGFKTKTSIELKEVVTEKELEESQTKHQLESEKVRYRELFREYFQLVDEIPHSNITPEKLELKIKTTLENRLGEI